MPDYPHIYGTPGPRPIAAGGTRVRMARRRTPSQSGEDRSGAEEGGGRDREAATWRELLQEAVADLNASFQRSGAPFACALEEDAQGYSLVVKRVGDGDTGEPIEEEILEPSELPQWLARIRTRLGILVDEKA